MPEQSENSMLVESEWDFLDDFSQRLHRRNRKRRNIYDCYENENMEEEENGNNTGDY